MSAYYGPGAPHGKRCTCSICKPRVAPRSRLDDVIAELMAYNAGIVSWDAAHVKELQAERLALLAKAARELPALAP